MDSLVQNGPKQLCISDLARQQLYRSKISNFLKTTACKSNNVNKNGQTTAESTISDLLFLFLKLIYMGQYNSRSCDYIYENLPISPTSRAINTKFGSVILHAPARNSISAIKSFFNKNISKNGNKPTSSYSVNRSIITNISIAIIPIFSGNTS